MGVSRTSVTLNWQPPHSTGGSPVTGYQVQLQAVTRAAVEVLGGDWLIVYDGPSTATTFSALQAGCSYMARVSARNRAGASPYGIALKFATAPDVPAPPPVPCAEVESTVSPGVWGWETRGQGSSASCAAVCCVISPHTLDIATLQPPASSLPPPFPPPQSLLLKWQPPSFDGGAPVASYRVEMRCSPQHANGDGKGNGVGPHQSLALTPHFLTIYSGAESCVQVTDLLPGTTYDFRVAAVNGQGGSGWSPVGSATTQPSAPMPPEAPAVITCSSTSLQLSWREPYGQGAPVTAYTVNMARLAGPRAAANGHDRAASLASDGSSGGDLRGHRRGGHLVDPPRLLEQSSLWFSCS
jgi:hypothetical protein